MPAGVRTRTWCRVPSFLVRQSWSDASRSSGFLVRQQAGCHDKDARSRLLAVPLFGPPNIQKLIDKQDLKGLAKALSDGDQSIRDQAANGLIQLNNPASVSFVIDVIRTNQDDAVINAGVHVLTQ